MPKILFKASVTDEDGDALEVIAYEPEKPVCLFVETPGCGVALTAEQVEEFAESLHEAVIAVRSYVPENTNVPQLGDIVRVSGYSEETVGIWEGELGQVVENHHAHSFGIRMLSGKLKGGVGGFSPDVLTIVGKAVGR